jgi:hypothetical protein
VLISYHEKKCVARDRSKLLSNIREIASSDSYKLVSSIIHTQVLRKVGSFTIGCAARVKCLAVMLEFLHLIAHPKYIIIYSSDNKLGGNNMKLTS